MSRRIRANARVRMGALRPTYSLWILALLSWAISSSVATPIFYESFSDLPWQQRWYQSERKGYEGTWTVEESDGNADLGIVTSEKSKKYAIARKLAEPLQFLLNRTIVLQYDVRFQKSIECSGAYLKFLKGDLDNNRHHAWNPKLFNSETPYSIMFGPDKCNKTNKVHFIFRHKSPKTGQILEHHLKFPPAPPSDKLSHVYTAVIYGHNSSMKLLIDGVPRRSSRLLSIEFDPPVLLPSTLPDPTDTKPADWDDRALIPDPERSMKPDDWDESEPLFIEDRKARKPKGWLDDVPARIPLQGSEPVRMVPNPKCVTAPGCGEWKRPTIRNPAFKGKWHPPTIRNPNFKGKWAPRRIPNPDYHHLDHAELAPIGGIGIEIFAMDDGVIFDNILITDNENEAQAYRRKTWEPKYTREKRLVDRSILMLLFDGFKFLFFELLRRSADASILTPYKPILLDHINNIERDLYLSRSVFLSIVVVWYTMLYRVLCMRRPKKQPANAAVNTHTAGLADANAAMPEMNTADATSKTDESDAPNGAANDDSNNEYSNTDSANARNGSANTTNTSSALASPPPTRFFF